MSRPARRKQNQKEALKAELHPSVPVRGVEMCWGSIPEPSLPKGSPWPTPHSLGPTAPNPPCYGEIKAIYRKVEFKSIFKNLFLKRNFSACSADHCHLPSAETPCTDSCFQRIPSPVVTNSMGYVRKCWILPSYFWRILENSCIPGHKNALLITLVRISSKHHLPFYKPN